jgi:nucleotide-binding universal stress UspA family protein
MRVLYATDGSTPSRQGERLIASLFDPALSHIQTFAVAPERFHSEPLVDGNFELARMDVPPLNAELVALEAADHLAEAGFEVSSASGRGDPAQEILHELQAGAHDLVVLGGSHTTWMGNLLLGSVSMHDLHHAPCSVIVTHRAPVGSGKVLFGADGSRGSTSSIDLAMQVLDNSRCSFTVATVVSQPWLSVAVYPPEPPFGSFAEYRDLEKDRMERAWRVVERVQSQLERNGFKAEGEVLLGGAGPQLFKEAENIRADLVVVGSRGVGPVRRAFLGSVSDQLARHAPATLVGRTTEQREITSSEAGIGDRR